MPLPPDADIEQQRPSAHVPVFVHPTLANDLVRYYGPKGHVLEQPPEVDPRSAARGSGAFTFFHGGKLNAVPAGDPVPPAAQQVQFHPRVTSGQPKPKEPTGREPVAPSTGGGGDFPGGAAGTDYSGRTSGDVQTGPAIDLPSESPNIDTASTGPHDTTPEAVASPSPSEPSVEINPYDPFNPYEPSANINPGDVIDDPPPTIPEPDALPMPDDEDTLQSKGG